MTYVGIAKERTHSGADDRRTLRILLAEDNDLNRRVIRAYLDKSDCRIEEAPDGERAFEKFKSQEFDLVLMDIQMPGMDGYRATKAIRAWEGANGKKAVPVIALTAHVNEEDIRKCIDAGCTAHLGKPVEGKMLLAMIAGLRAGPRMEKEGKIRHLIPKFMKEMTASCRSIEAAAEKNDLDAIVRECHGIKGLGGMFGFHELSEIGARLESAALAGDLAETKRLFAKFARHLREVKNATNEVDDS